MFSFAEIPPGQPEPTCPVCGDTPEWCPDTRKDTR